jgi:hypothetical protein
MESRSIFKSRGVVNNFIHEVFFEVFIVVNHFLVNFFGICFNLLDFSPIFFINCQRIIVNFWFFNFIFCFFMRINLALISFFDFFNTL